MKHVGDRERDRADDASRSSYPHHVCLDGLASKATHDAWAAAAGADKALAGYCSCGASGSRQGCSRVMEKPQNHGLLEALEL